MNTRRIAAIVGLILMGVTVLGIVLSALLPAYHELTLTVSGIAFLLSVTVLGILKRGSSKEDGGEDEEEPQA